MVSNRGMVKRRPHRHSHILLHLVKKVLTLAHRPSIATPARRHPRPSHPSLRPARRPVRTRTRRESLSLSLGSRPTPQLSLVCLPGRARSNRRKGRSGVAGRASSMPRSLRRGSRSMAHSHQAPTFRNGSGHMIQGSPRPPIHAHHPRCGTTASTRPSLKWLRPHKTASSLLRAHSLGYAR
jgi:hypothetical protein